MATAQQRAQLYGGIADGQAGATWRIGPADAAHPGALPIPPSGGGGTGVADAAGETRPAGVARHTGDALRHRVVCGLAGGVSTARRRRCCGVARGAGGGRGDSDGRRVCRRPTLAGDMRQPLQHGVHAHRAVPSGERLRGRQAPCRRLRGGRRRGVVVRYRAGGRVTARAAAVRPGQSAHSSGADTRDAAGCGSRAASGGRRGGCNRRTGSAESAHAVFCAHRRHSGVRRVRLSCHGALQSSGIEDGWVERVGNWVAVDEHRGGTPGDRARSSVSGSARRRSQTDAQHVARSDWHSPRAVL
eukprot:ctg_1196.g383